VPDAPAWRAVRVAEAAVAAAAVVVVAAALPTAAAVAGVWALMAGGRAGGVRQGQKKSEALETCIEGAALQEKLAHFSTTLL